MTGPRISHVIMPPLLALVTACGGGSGPSSAPCHSTDTVRYADNDDAHRNSRSTCWTACTYAAFVHGTIASALPS